MSLGRIVSSPVGRHVSPRTVSRSASYCKCVFSRNRHPRALLPSAKKSASAPSSPRPAPSFFNVHDKPLPPPPLTSALRYSLSTSDMDAHHQSFVRPASWIDTDSDHPGKKLLSALVRNLPPWYPVSVVAHLSMSDLARRRKDIYLFTTGHVN